jgi:hypothetical protein
LKAVSKAIIIIHILLLPALTYAARQAYYVTQNGTNYHNGISLSNAWSVSDFNSLSNWSTIDDANKIDPGDTVYFNGTITSQIAPKGSGTSNNYITLDGGSSTVAISANSLEGTSGSINIENKSYLRIQNFTIDGKTQPANALSDRAGIWIEGYQNQPSQHIVIDNCTIYDHSSGIMAYDNAHDITVKNSYVHEVRNNCFGATVYHSSWGSVSNMTIGGSSDGSNEFKNCGYNSDPERSGSSPDIELAICNDSIISYNKTYATLPNHGMGGIMIEESKRILIEYNTVHGHYAVNNRGGIVIKEDSPYHTNDDIIIRFNHVYDELQEGKPIAWGKEKAGIHAGSDVHNIFIYGNYVHDTHWGIRLMENFSGPDGRNNENFYVFSNIVANTEEQGIALNGSKDAFVNVYLFNNTIYRSSYSSLFVTGPEKTSIADKGMTASQLQNIHINNNVIVDSRPNQSDYLGIFWILDDDTFIDYNHHYHTKGNPTVYYKNSACTFCSWQSTNRPNDYGNHDTGGDPLLKNMVKGDFRIGSPSSPLIKSGIKVGSGVIAKITVQGTTYPVQWDAALDPYNTDWSTVPSKVAVLYRDEFGSWEKGAYIYRNDSQNALSQPKNLKIRN